MDGLDRMDRIAVRFPHLYDRLKQARYKLLCKGVNLKRLINIESKWCKVIARKYGLGIP